MKKLSLIAAIILLASCAKERPVEKIITSGLAEQRLQKNTFTSSQHWYSKATVVSRSETTPSKRLFVGNASDLKLGFFKFDRDKLIFQDAISSQQDNQSIPDIIYSWDIEHSEYHLEEKNGEVTNIEEENDHISWEAKNFFKVNFAKANISPKKDISATDSSCWSTKSATIVEDSQSYSSKHIAYTVEYVYEYNSFFQLGCRPVEKLFESVPTYTVNIRYSFKPRTQSTYEPYIYSGVNDPLMRKYGYFKTRVNRYNDYGIDETIWLMNRWDPKKVHTYYFAEDTPEKLKIYYTHPQNGIFKKINDTLAETGEPIRFKIKDYDESVCQFGDVKCSFIKINTSAHNGAPLGYGPSYADPLTGEIISGNTMIWTSSSKKRIGHYLKVLSDTNVSAPENSSMYRLMKKTLKKSDIDQWTHTAEPLKSLEGTTANIYRFLLPEYTYTRRNYLHTSFIAMKDSSNDYIKTINSLNDEFEQMDSSQLLITSFDKEMMDMLDDEIETHKVLSKYEIEEYFHKQKSNRHVDSSDSILGMVNNMVISGRSGEEIFAGLFYHTAIHELGHTLNLEHNFYGSVDNVNFEPVKVAMDINGSIQYKKDANGNTTQVALTHQPSSTTVMEYMTNSDTLDETLDWGPYDKAALLYAYSSGQKDVDKKFLFCTHDSVNEMSLCNMHDNGITPSEIAMSLITSYENWFPIRNYRTNRNSWSTIGYGRSRESFMKKLKTFMKMQQTTFERSDMHSKLALTDFSAEEIETAHEEIQADMKQAVKLVLAFYDAVIHQKNRDRNFKDSWNNGLLVKKGIWHDKFYAMKMLYQNQYMLYDPSKGNTLTSSLNYFEDDDRELASIYSEVIKNGLINQVDEYVNVDLYRINQFIMSTVESPAFAGNGSVSNTDLMGIRCLTKDIYSAFSTEPLKYKDAMIVDVPLESLPEYYAQAIDEDTTHIQLALIKEGNKAYVASKIHNPFTFELVKDMVDSISYNSELEWLMTRSIQKVKSISKMYNIAMGDDIYSCY